MFGLQGLPAVGAPDSNLGSGPCNHSTWLGRLMLEIEGEGACGDCATQGVECEAPTLLAPHPQCFRPHFSPSHLTMFLIDWITMSFVLWEVCSVTSRKACLRCTQRLPWHPRHFLEGKPGIFSILFENAKGNHSNFTEYQ